MEKMLPPSKGLSNKILLEKAVKFGINKKTAEGLLRNNEYKSLTQMIDKRIEVKTNEMLKKSDQIFKKLNRNSKKSKTSNTKRDTLLRNQNFELKLTSPAFKLGFKQIEMSNIGLNETLYPEKQMNGKIITDTLKHLNIYASKLGSYQEKGYSYILEQLSTEDKDLIEAKETVGFSNLQKSLQSLNIVYPNSNFENLESHY